MPIRRSARIRRPALIVSALLVITFFPADFSRAQSAESRVKEYIGNVKQELDEAREIASGLRARARLAVGITVVAAFLSLTSGLMPQVRKKWAKTAALVLGFLAGTTTIVNNNYFGVDSTLLDDNSYDLEREVTTMRDQLDSFVDIERTRTTPEYEDNLLTWQSDTIHKMSTFRDRREELRRPVRRRSQEPPKDSNVDRSGGFLTTLHAQGQQMQRALPPAWVRKTPADDDRYIYFVGKGIDPDSLSAAKELSVRDANRQAETLLAARANTCLVPALRDRAAKETEIAGTYFSSGTVDGSNMRAYTYSTLLRLSKAFADPSMLKGIAARSAGDVVKIPLSRVAAPRQLGANVGVFAGPRSAGTVRILVFNTPNLAARWPATRNVRYEELKKNLSPAQILQDVSLGRCGDTTVRSGDARYVLTVMATPSGSDQTVSVAIAAERMATARD